MFLNVNTFENRQKQKIDFFDVDKVENYLKKLKDFRPRSSFSVWFFSHDNAPGHRDQNTHQFLENSALKGIEHPPYSPDLVTLVYFQK